MSDLRLFPDGKQAQVNDNDFCFSQKAHKILTIFENVQHTVSADNVIFQ